MYLSSVRVGIGRFFCIWPQSPHGNTNKVRLISNLFIFACSLSSTSTEIKKPLESQSKYGSASLVPWWNKCYLPSLCFAFLCNGAACAWDARGWIIKGMQMRLSNKTFQGAERSEWKNEVLGGRGGGVNTFYEMYYHSTLSLFLIFSQWKCYLYCSG